MGRNPYALSRTATAALLAAYFAVAVWGAAVFDLEDVPAPLIWPASGIGLALVLTHGTRIWPAIFVAATLAATLAVAEGGMGGQQFGGALLNGASAALEAVVAAWLIRRIAGDRYLERPVPFFWAMAIAAPVACFVSAVPLAVGQFVGGLVTTYSWAGFVGTWHTSALSDALGLLALGPPLVLWLADPTVGLSRRQGAELAAWLGGTGLLLATPAPDKVRYALVVVHLAIALRLPLKWAMAAVAITALVYLSRSALALHLDPAVRTYIFFLRESAFGFSLLLATHLTALLHKESELRALRAEALARELGDAEHRERRRIAEILHDHLQQLLVAAKMAVARLRRGNQDAGERAEHLIGEAIENARALSAELHPAAIDAFGLAGALRWLAEDMRRRFELTIHVEDDGSTGAETPEIRAFAFQCVRELLLNVVKHSGADTAWVHIHRTQGWVHLEIRDDGTGCDPKEALRVREAHEGLYRIRHRTKLLGGHFTMSGRHGCRVRMSLPAGGVAT